MSVQLFILRGVPDDEADEIRELLSCHNISYYETPAGSWGMSMPAIWLQDENQLPQAKLLLREYQDQRKFRVQEEYNQLKREEKNKTTLDGIKENPLRFIVYLTIVLIVIYLSTKPFIDFGH